MVRCFRAVVVVRMMSQLFSRYVEPPRMGAYLPRLSDSLTEGAMGSSDDPITDSIRCNVAASKGK